ncbi:MAG: heavy metal-binding domain-containing protein [Planctomycetota bacterium]|jgi:YHS domain-containing protein
MFRTSSLRPLTITATVCAVLVSAPFAAGQSTRPAAPAAGMDPLTVTVWTCPVHEQVRTPTKDACPVCGTDPVRATVILQGAGASGDPYPLDTCPVTGQELGSMGNPVVLLHGGREVRFCCKGCIQRFEKDATKYFAQMDRQIIKQQLPYYPLTTCPVSGEALGSMGEPVNFVQNNRLVRLCCKGCLRSLKRNPAPYISTLDQAVIVAQTESYPLATCVISKQKLGSMGEPIDYVVGNRLVRFCCAGCMGTFNRAPAAHLATIDKAWKKSGGLKGEHANEGKSNEHDEHEEHDHDR